jgi:hypothetical protein
MTYVLGVLLTAILAVGYGLLHRGKPARDCHSCEAGDERGACEGCPINVDPSDRSASRPSETPLTLV